MECENIKVDYQNTPEKFRQAAEEALSFLVEHLRELNAIQTECTQLALYAQRGIRIPKKPKDEKGIWELFKSSYGKALSSFCSKELMARGYANCMCHEDTDAAKKRGEKEKIYCEYGYLSSGCQLFVTMKSPKRVIVEAFFEDAGGFLPTRHKLTLTYADGWQVTDKRRKGQSMEKWRKDSM